MVDIAASVLTRLKNKAQASGRSYQLLSFTVRHNETISFSA